MVVLFIGAVLFLVGFFVPFNLDFHSIQNHGQSIYNLLKNNSFNKNDLFSLWNQVKDSLNSEGRTLFIIAFAGFGVLLFSAVWIIVNIVRSLPIIGRRR